VERVGGVREARFSYTEGSGEVTFDTTRTSPAEFIERLTAMTGFDARVADDP
jgi:copper chaperone CopZ